jgi:hypothetical protein
LKKRPKTAKNKAIAFKFRPFLATYFIFETWPKTAKSRAIAFTFRPFLATYFIFEKEAKNSKTVRLYPLLFVHF